MTSPPIRPTKGRTMNLNLLIGMVVHLLVPRRRDERGLSQST